MRGALVVSCPMAGVLGSGACRPRARTQSPVYAEASPCPPAMPPAARGPRQFYLQRRLCELCPVTLVEVCGGVLSRGLPSVAIVGQGSWPTPQVDGAGAGARSPWRPGQTHWGGRGLVSRSR